MGAGGQGGEALDVHPKEARDGLGLGVTERGVLLGHPADRAVALAELDAGERAGSDGTGRGGIPVLGHRLDEGRGASAEVVSIPQPGGVAGLEPGHPLTGERGDRLGPTRLLEVAEGLRGEALVVGRERGVTPLGDDVGAGRTPPPTGVRRGRVVRSDGRLLDERVEVATHGGGGQPQQATDLGRRDWSAFGHGGQDALTRPLLVRPDKHHTIVT